jgi:hypothetical protein
MKISGLKVDQVAEDDGVWLQYQSTEVFFRVARLSCARMQEQLAALRRATIEGEAGPIDIGDAHRPEAQKALAPYVARGILRGWRGLDEDDGSPMEFSPERAAELLADPAMKDVFQFIVVGSSRADNFRAKSAADSSGN